MEPIPNTAGVNGLLLTPSWGLGGEVTETGAILKYLKSKKSAKMEITKLVSLSFEIYIQYEPGQRDLYNSASLETKLNLLKTHHSTYKIVFCYHISRKGLELYFLIVSY